MRSFLKVDNLPYTKHYVQQTQAGNRTSHIAALHRKRQPWLMNLVSGQHKEIVLAPGRTRDPGKDNQQNSDLETDQNKEENR
jgi:hypothetical protein